MKIFKVYASEEVTKGWEYGLYDEYFGHVLIADNEEEAL